MFDKLNLKCRKKDFNKATDCSEEQTDEFSLPLTNAKHFNNGIQFYGRPDEWDSAEMTIDIVSNGAIATGDVYAQPQRTGVLWDSYLVKCKYEITSELVLLYMACVIQRCIKQYFGWDDKCTWDKVKEQYIKLPITSAGEPDWTYMESYMKQILKESEKSLENLKKVDYTKHLIDVSGWGEFRVGDLFDVSRPSSRSSQKYEKGDMPFVASGNFNNGVTDYLQPKDENDFEEGNCITVSAVDGYAFYQKEKFLGRGGAGSSIMLLRNDNLNKMNGKYICTLIRRACNDWEYSNMGNKDKLADTIIWLPITTAGEPDWAYMESYMKQIMDKSEQIISNLQGKIEI